MQIQISWVDSANDPSTDFPLENLPFGVFRAEAGPRIGVAIGDCVLDLRAAAGAGLLDGLPPRLTDACRAPVLNPLMEQGRAAASALRRRLTELLAEKSRDRAKIEPLLLPQSGIEMLLPASIGDYTDFYASIHHATNVGRLFRADDPLLPNYKHLPIGYHGRASSIVVSGTPVQRPHGQRKSADCDAPVDGLVFGPTSMLDYELEAGFFIGAGNVLGEPVPLAQAEDHIFGFCLLNDWSARDMQSWEYQPLGPFLAKSFATTISPWVVTLDALQPFRLPPAPRPKGDPEPLPYLVAAGNQVSGAIDLHLEVFLQTERMRREGHTGVRLSRSHLRDLYWTPAQMLAHHTSNGCNLRSGDLLATGTVSGPEPEALGSLLEITRRGAEPLQLPDGESRAFLEDGDEVILRGWCEREGLRRIGFGECRGRILPAR
ncbi:fumarylacetoacetase [Paracidobacterium acidisoli]|uniref:fumarylacetoacetase n=1 Tax=Paracidobacterium acidisoli TaxID=2303751 RepID=A0A372IVN3_9BACT|nr:fumarylacetoacetase [Paracidobacterium acidisoli]MBT9329903.1 fumarylacetoacetase [Paracidobacterium acidisoli]